MRTAEGIARRKERDRLYKQKLRQENPEEQKALMRAWKEKNIEKVRAHCRNSYAKTIEKRRAYERLRYQRDKKKRLAGMKKWRQDNPEKYKAVQGIYRARKHAVHVNDFTPLQWVALQNAYDHRCVYCQKRCKNKLTIDHVVPLSQGGQHTLANVVPSCRSCNSRKRAGPILAPFQMVLLL